MPDGGISTSISLSADERAAFDRDGFVRIAAAFPRAHAARMEAEWWAELTDGCGARPGDPSSWRPPKGDLKRPKTAASQRLMETPRVRGALDALLGQGEWDWPRDWGRAVVTMPSGEPPEAWDVPDRVWHWDGLIAWNLDRLASLFVAAFVGDVRPAGGGTAVLAGSPRLLLQKRAEFGTGRGELETVRRDRFSRCNPWLAALTGHAPSPPDRIAAFMSEVATIDGVDLRVVELAGEPGDMVFCHPLLLHCVVFAYGRLEAARFARCDLAHARFEGAELYDVRLEDCQLLGAVFHRTSFGKAFGRKVERIAAEIVGCNLELADLSGARLPGCRLARSRLREADLSGADLSDADLTGADLFHAILDGATLTGADLTGAEVSGLDLRRLAAYQGLKITPDQQYRLLDAMGIDVRAE